MPQQVFPPEPTASIEVHADWIEWLCVTSRDGRVSWSDYGRNLRLTGSEDEFSEHGDYGDEPIEGMLDAIASEIQARQRACSPEGYPFVIEAGALLLQKNADDVPYLFMLALALWGKDAGGAGFFPERLFEDLAAIALARYVGSPAANVRRLVFGFPRRLLPKAFPAAVDNLASELREGVGICDEPEVADMKDAALDVVVWRSFPDEAPGQLILFGQCATGLDWRDKVTHLRPPDWCKAWMRKSPLVNPVGAFFVPRQIDDRRWRVSGIHAGILFDRCRTSWLTTGVVDAQLRNELEEWLRNVKPNGGSSAS